MDQKDFRENLELKPVTQEHIDQFNELLSYVFQVTEADIEESGFENKRAFIRSKRPILEVSKVFGWFHENKLISQIAIYPCEVNIHGARYKMGGVTGVGTYPEYANHGLMQDLIIVALDNMRKNKQWISYLYPYSIPYYRRKGWEIMSDKLSFKIRDTQLPKQVPVSGMVERLPVDHQMYLPFMTNLPNETMVLYSAVIFIGKNIGVSKMKMSAQPLSTTIAIMNQEVFYSTG